MCLKTKGKYGKVTDTEIKWSIISKSVMIIIFVEFINQLIDYPIHCASISTKINILISQQKQMISSPSERVLLVNCTHNMLLFYWE